MACSTAARGLAECAVELPSTRMEISTEGFLERHDINPIDSDVTEIGHGRMVGEHLGESGRGERVSVVSGAVHRPRPDRDQGTVKGRGDLQVDARVADLR
jgi:hypothetical protein